jgi:hypothetical protein
VSANSRNTVFVSYCRADRAWLQRLRTHLAPLDADQVLDLWDDTMILPGQDWRAEIEAALVRARVAVLLISADFLASDFIRSEELPRLLAAAEAGGATILPVIVSASRFADTPALSRFQAVNAPERPLDGLGKAARERVLVAVSSAVEQALTARVGLESSVQQDVLDSRQRRASSHDTAVSGAGGSGEDRDGPHEVDWSSGLSSSDPLIFFPTVARLPTNQDVYELLLDTTSSSRAHDEVLRDWLARQPLPAGKFLTDTIRDCPVTGPGWFRASRAGELFSPGLQSAQGQVYALLTSGEIEPMRHALVAYGHLGQSLSSGFLRAHVLTDSYEVEKGLSYAVSGWTAAYLTAAAWQITTAGRDLRDCIEWFWTDRPNAYPKPSVDLRAVSSAHYDDLITTWLRQETPSYVKSAALRALGERGVSRAVPAITQLLTDEDAGTREDAARALGGIGGAMAVKALEALPESASSRQQIVHVAHELDDNGLDEVIRLYGADGASWTDTWLARSIGLARAARHSGLIKSNLGSQMPAVRGTSAIAAARLGLCSDLTKVVYEAEPGLERAMATAGLLTSRPGDYGRVEAVWRSDLVGSLHEMPARLVEDLFTCVADVPEARSLIDAWRPVVATWGARI